MKSGIWLIIVFLCAYNLNSFAQVKVLNKAFHLFELAQFEKQLEKPNLFSNITDSINSTSIFEDYIWHFSETIDTLSETISYSLTLENMMYLDDYCIKERNIYAIQLTKYDSVFIEGKYTSRTDTFGNSIKEFIVNPDFAENLPQKKWYRIEYFDSVFLTKQAFYIMAEMVKDSNGISSSWIEINEILKVVLRAYFNLRNDLAKSEWDKSFDELEFRNKIACIQYFPIRIEFHLNNPRLLPPLPPPYETTEEYQLDSINNYYRKKALEELINE